MRFLTQISVEMTNIHQTNILSMLFFIEIQIIVLIKKPDNYEKIKFRRTEG